LKVADFGLARTLCTKRRSNADLDCKDELDNEAMLTDYVATRWYRAPEILVASRKYTKGIDMWSLGCILGEMIRQKPLFQGTSTINQIEKIVNALPEVTDRDIESIGASFGSVLLSKKIVRDRRYSLDEILRNCCDDALSLVKSLLVLDPEGRLTAKEAIAHSYVHRFRTSSANMELRADIRPPLDDDTRYGVDEYRTTLYEMIAPELRSSEGHSSTTPVISTVSSDQPSSQTPSGARSESKSRQSASSSQATVQTDPPGQPISTLTKAWVEEQRKQQHFQTHPHQHTHTHPHPHAQPPRCIGGIWRTPVTSQSGTVVPPLHLWEESPPTAAEIEVVGEGLCSTAQLRARVRKLRRECKERRMARTKADEQHRRSTPAESVNKYKEHISRPRQASPSGLAKSRAEAIKQQLKEYTQTKNADRQHSKALRFDPAHGHAPAPRRSSSNSSDSSRTVQAFPPAQSDAAASQTPSAEEQQRKDRKSAELTTALERMQLEHRELQQKKCNINDADGGNQRSQLPPKHQMRKMVRESTGNGMRAPRHQRRVNYLSPGNRADRFYTPEGTVRPVDKVVPMDEKTDDALRASNASAAFICYKTRLLRLEEEMAKCKRQLFHYVQDNQQLLNKQGLRHHIERLLHSPPSVMSNKSENTPVLPPSAIKSTIKTPQSDSGVEADHPKLDRDKQKQLQLREFLARDESDANAYELPNLSSVYKTSSCHVPPLSNRPDTSKSSRPLSSTSTHTKDCRSSSLAQHSHKLAHAYSNYFPVGSSKGGYENAWHKRHHAHGHNAKRHHSLAPRCDRLRIQEANFLDGYSGSHATRK
ncbi:uncharacterized protein Dmoj_GI15342, partial [Drosophila mojavensis]